MTGALSKCFENRSVSIVAEVMMIFRSGRRGSSCFRYPEQEIDIQAALVGLVDDQGVVLVKLTIMMNFGQRNAIGHELYVAVGRQFFIEGGPESRPPAPVPVCISSATRRATERAAIRRGWVQPISPRCPRPASRQSCAAGSDLPEPVSPATISTWWSRMAATMSSARALIGRSGASCTRGRLLQRC